MKMQVGNLKQKANWFLVGFVFGCIFVTTGLLIMLQKSTEVGLNLSYDPSYNEYYQ